MDSLSYKTQNVNKATADKKWVVVDAQDAVVGRLSSEVAKILKGKNKPSYTPNADCGDNVIVINSDGLRFTGNKMNSKVYLRHTGYTGGQRATSFREMMEKSSRFVIEKAVKGMLPKNKLGRAIFKNLYVYEGAEHPHAAQKPIQIKF